MEITTIIAICNSSFVLAVFTFCAPRIWRCFNRIFPCLGSDDGNSGNEANPDQPTGNQTNHGQSPAVETGPGTSQNAGDEANPDQSTGNQTNHGQSPAVETGPGPSQGGQSSGRLKFLEAEKLEIKNMNNKMWCEWDYFHGKPRFDKVAKLKTVCWLEINAKINFRELSPNTKYAAYIIFKTTPKSKGLNITQWASVSVNEEIIMQKEVCLKPTNDTPSDGSIILPRPEVEGWMELYLGQFECDNVTGDKEAVISIAEVNNTDIEKKELFVAGIELRPI